MMPNDETPILHTGERVDYTHQPVLYMQENNIYFGETKIATSLPKQPLLALVVDVGTTTVSATLVDVTSGLEIDAISGLNPQRQFGQEVLSRITYYQNNKASGLDEMQRAILTLIESFGEELTTKHGYQPSNIYSVCVSSNAVMNHILIGVNPEPLALAPYDLQFKQSKIVSFETLELSAFGEGVVVTVPNISAFVGGDIVAGMLATGIHHDRQTSLFVDIGTNGEMILNRAGKLYATSCAAGPALEGMMITCGVTAQPGAIEEAHFDGAKLTIQTIQNQVSTGICGSGILALIREFLAVGLITTRGNIQKRDTAPESLQSYIMTDKKGLWVDKANNIYITQKDVRMIQLAKGAILSGVQALLNASKKTPEEVTKVYISGQFGSYLSEASLLGVGLLPKAFANKINYMGNTSQSGCYLFMMDKDLYQEAQKVVETIETVELSAVESYSRLFAKASLFPDE